MDETSSIPCPLDAHVRERIGQKDGALTLEGIRAYQDARIRQVFRHAKQNSRFYASLYQDIADIRGLEDIAALPILRDRDIMENDKRMLATEQERICRIYTTSGSTGAPKRLYYTAEELEDTVLFYLNGIRMFMAKGDTVLIFLPCSQQYSVGLLFADSVERLGAKAICHGLPKDMDEAYAALIKSGANVTMSPPAVMTGMRSLGLPLPRLKTIILSTDGILREDKAMLTAAFGAAVHEHYAMTEMCFGGAVECGGHIGLHNREADFYIEILDSRGQPVPDGEYGELAFTTLRREAMPLIRYATGDVTRFLPIPCPCGSVLPLIAPIQKRPVPKRYS